MVVCRRRNLCFGGVWGVNKTRVETRTDRRPDMVWYYLGRAKISAFANCQGSTQPSSVVEQTSASKSQHPERACDTKIPIFLHTIWLCRNGRSLVLIPTVLKTALHPKSATRETLKRMRETPRHQHRDIGDEL
jgi:hypothetical protein